jgi:hypothetical protein
MSVELEIGRRGASFFTELFGADVGEGKQYRELSKNAFEAIEEYRKAHPEDREYRPQIEAYVDPHARDWPGESGGNKIAFADNGIGMTQQTMSNLNQIFSSTKAQSLEGNYGIGARAATLRFNIEGVEFRSWRDRKGYTCTLAKLREDGGIPIYGFVNYEFPDGTNLNIVPLEPPFFEADELALMKPPFIKDHGTVVVLHGISPEADTTLMPEGLREEIPADGRSRENSSYCTIPDGIEFRLALEPAGPNTEGSTQRKNIFRGNRTLRNVKGTKHYLTTFGKISGSVFISDAVVHWWILGDADKPVEPQKTNRETGKPMTYGEQRKRFRVWYPWLTGTSNHAIVSAIHQGEQFDLSTKVDAVRTLQKFGVFAGHNNICIVVEPNPDQELRSNMNRTSLLLNKRKLPWERWGREFAQRYPTEAPELLAYIESKLGSTDFDVELDRLLNEMNDDFSVPTPAQRRSKQKTSDLEDPDGVPKAAGRRSGDPNPNPMPRPRPEPDPERVIVPRNPPLTKTRYKPIDLGSHSTMQQLNQPRPKVKFLTEAEHQGAFRGRAADYMAEATSVYPSGIVYINSDFDVLHKLVDESLATFFATDEAREKAYKPVKDIVELVYSAQILFAVMTYRHSFMVGHGADWPQEEARKLVSPEALTAVVLARPGMREQIKRRINSKAELRLLAMQQSDPEAVSA